MTLEGKQLIGQQAVRGTRGEAFDDADDDGVR